MSNKVPARSASATAKAPRKSGSVTRGNAAGAAHKKRPATSHSHRPGPAPAKKTLDQSRISEDAGRAHGAAQSSQLVRGLGSNFAPAAKGAQPIEANKTLRRGDGFQGKANDSVKQMQQSLIKAGFGKDLGSSGADGKFGPKTQEAVRKFQEKSLGKEAADGVVGPKTFEALNKGQAEGTQPSASKPDPAAAQPGAKKTDPSTAQPGAKKPEPTVAEPGAKKPPSSPQEHLLGLLDKGTNRDRITKMNPAFAKDFSGMMRELQEKHQFQPRITSGWRPGHGHSNHFSGSAADFTAANRKSISDDQLKMMRQVAAKHGLKILDERHHGYNSSWSGSHLHVSRTGR